MAAVPAGGNDADEFDDAPDAVGFFCRAGIVDRMADYDGFFGGCDKNSEAPRTKLSGEARVLEWNER